VEQPFSKVRKITKSVWKKSSQGEITQHKLKDTANPTRHSETPSSSNKSDSNSDDDFSDAPTTYLALPLELRQQILSDAFDDNIFQMKMPKAFTPIDEYEWYRLQWYLGEAIKVYKRREAVLRAVHPQVSLDIEDVVKKAPREVKEIATMVVEIEELKGYVMYPRWFVQYAE
jgi:hypothetical protein